MDEQESKPYIKVPVSDFLERVYDRQEKLVDSVHEINITLAKQHISLDEHIKRSKAAEEAIEILRSELKPVQKHIDIEKFAIKVVAGILSSASLVYLVKFFLKN